MKRSSALSRWSLLSVCVFLFAGLAVAQEKLGTLQGTISDETDAVLPGVEITLASKSSGRTMTSTAGAYGDYTFRNLEPGRYSIAFRLAGFTRAEYPSIDVLAGQSLKLNATLKPGAVTTTVQVTDVAPIVNSQDSSVVFHISAGQFESLPKARTFQQLAILAPGVSVGEIEGGTQINGASGAETGFLIDGVATNSTIDGRSRQNAVFEYLEEVQIQTGGFEASRAGALGGVISAVTRSGGNAFHGNAWLNYSGDFLNAAPPKRLALNPTDNRTTAYYQDHKSGARGIEPGFALGGPIRRNQLYFFTSWSPQWMRVDQPYAFGNGTEHGVIRRERRFMSGFNKISFDPGTRVRANFSWLWTPSRSHGSLPVYNGSCADCVTSSQASNAINKERGAFNPQSTYTASIDFVASPSVIVSARGNYFWDNYKDTGIPSTTSVQYQTPGPQGGVGFQNTPALLSADHDRIARASGYFDAGITSHGFGLHNFKTGFATEKTVNDVNRSYPGGYVYLWWDRSFTSPITTTADRGTYGYYEVNDFRTLGSAAGNMKALYGQDNWRITDRLTVNAGVRFETENVPSFRRDIKSPAIHFGLGDKIAPRVGGAFDIFGDGKVRVFGSWGRYFDPVRYELARNVFGGEMWRTYYRSLDTLDVFTLNLNNMPGRDLWNPTVAGAYRDRRNPTAGLQSVAKDLKPMSQDQWSGGLNYQWSQRTTMGARYTHQKLRRAIEDLAVLVGGNASYIYANPGEGSAVSAPFTTGLTTRPLNYPKPVRNYDAVEVTLASTAGAHWFGNLSYTWSRLFGNYPGTADSDEILTPATGLSYATAQQPGGSIAHPARNANLAWDLDEILFDSKGHLDPRGLLPTDRTHVLKANGGYSLQLGRIGTTNVGGFFYLGSGTPLSTQVYTTNALPILVNGRGDMGRSPMLNYTDLQIAHTIDLAETQSLRVELNVLNAFNQKTVQHRFTAMNRGAGVSVNSSAINLSGVDLRKGYDYNALIQATPDGANALDPRYGKDDLFSDGVSARLAVKWSF